LLCNRSSRPHVWMAASTIAATPTSAETSTTWATASAPAAFTTWAAASALVGSMSAHTTWAPASANACTTARPMPPPAPVTTATRRARGRITRAPPRCVPRSPSVTPMQVGEQSLSIGGSTGHELERNTGQRGLVARASTCRQDSHRAGDVVPGDRRMRQPHQPSAAAG
jgi:hypothetical protein